MIKYKKLTNYKIYKSVYDTVYEDNNSRSSWRFVNSAVKTGDFKLYSLLENDITVGVCGFSKILGGVTIYELMVKKDSQGKGYGKRILNYTISQIRRLSNPPKIIMAFTNAKYFFEINDFEEIEYNKDAIDKYTMMLLL